jgi:manganese transport protein
MQAPVGADMNVIESPSAPQPAQPPWGWRVVLVLMGPAFVASIAYVDPGNFATNVQAGARYGYLLLWVVVLANVVAMLLQYLSAKLGVATGRSLPELCRDHYAKPVVWGLWAQAEIVAIMTDLAELVGGAVAVQLLFGVPLFAGGVMIALVSFVVVSAHSARQRRFEAIITGLLLVVTLAFLYETLHGHPPASHVLGGFVPQLRGRDSVLLASGIVGATVMPHVIYLHSALTQQRFAGVAGTRRGLLRVQRADVLVAMSLAGAVNLAMVVAAGSLLHGSGGHTDTLQGAYSAFGQRAGTLAAGVFAVALLASGLASSSVAMYAGQAIMQGFLQRRVPVVVRRLASVIPALAILALSKDTTRALVLSQVVLSFGIPFALVPLVLLTRQADLMGDWVNRRRTTAAASGVAVVIIALNCVLIVLAVAA